MKLSAPNRSVQEWEQTILQLVPEEDARIANRISNLIFGISFSQVLYGYYHERCQFLNSTERKLEGPFYEACDRFLYQKQEGILELSQEFVFKNFDVFNNTLHSLIITTARQYSKSEMKAIQSDIARYRDHFIELANGNTEFVDQTIQGVTEMLYENCVYDDGNVGSKHSMEENDNESSPQIIFDIEALEKLSVVQVPYLLFPGATEKAFFKNFSLALKKQGFISSAELFVYRFFPVLDNEIDLNERLLWCGELESLIYLFLLLISKKKISDPQKTKKGKSLTSMLSEVFCDANGAPIKANTLRQILLRKKEIEQEPPADFDLQKCVIYTIFKSYHQ